jgi:surface polysaccharide O-acyltransferase-like enzyme
MNSNDRLVWASNIRVAATLAVILTHVASGFPSVSPDIHSFQWNVGNIVLSATRFCVPFFLLLSGALLLKKKEDVDVFFKKRFSRILLPFAFWSIIYSFYSLFSETNASSLSFFQIFKFLYHHFFFKAFYHLWFMFVLIGLYLIFPILAGWLRNVDRKEIRYFLFFWAVIIICNFTIGYFPAGIELQYISGYIGYPILGYYLAYFVDNNKRTLLFAIISSFTGIFLTIITTYFYSSKSGHFDAKYYDFLSPNVLMMSVGIFLMIKRFSASPIKHRFHFRYLIDKYSFGIYLSHAIFLDIFFKSTSLVKHLNPLIFYPLITVSCVSVSLVAVYLISRLPYGKYIAG